MRRTLSSKARSARCPRPSIETVQTPPRSSRRTAIAECPGEIACCARAKSACRPSCGRKPDAFRTGRSPGEKTAKGDIPDTQRTYTLRPACPRVHARYMLPVGIGGVPFWPRCPPLPGPADGVKSAVLTRARANPVQTSHQGAITAQKWPSRGRIGWVKPQVRMGAPPGI